MNLTPAEVALVELIRAMGSEPLHVAFTSTGAGVSFTLLSTETGPVAGWGATVEDALANAYRILDPEPIPSRCRLRLRGFR